MLTAPHPAAILSPPVNTPAGFRSSERQGAKTPIQGVFYCQKKIVAPLVRILSMAARNGQPKGWPEPCPGTANLLRVAAQQFAVVGGGLFLRQGATA